MMIMIIELITNFQMTRAKMECVKVMLILCVVCIWAVTADSYTDTLVWDGYVMSKICLVMALF